MTRTATSLAETVKAAFADEVSATSAVTDRSVKSTLVVRGARDLTSSDARRSLRDRTASHST